MRALPRWCSKRGYEILGKKTRDLVFDQRRRQDSNLRIGCPINGLASRRLRPLGHASGTVSGTDVVSTAYAPRASRSVPRWWVGLKSTGGAWGSRRRHGPRGENPRPREGASKTNASPWLPVHPVSQGGVA